MSDVLSCDICHLFVHDCKCGEPAACTIPVRHAFKCIHLPAKPWSWLALDGCQGSVCSDCLRSTIFTWAENLKIKSPTNVIVSRAAGAAVSRLAGASGEAL
jgi:hypothetical protein